MKTERDSSKIEKVGDMIERVRAMSDSGDSVVVKVGNNFCTGKVIDFDDIDDVEDLAIDPMVTFRPDNRKPGEDNEFCVLMEEFLEWQDARELEVEEYMDAPLVVQEIHDSLAIRGLIDTDKKQNFQEMIKKEAGILKAKFFDPYKLPTRKDVADYFGRDDLSYHFKSKVWSELFHNPDRFELLTEEYIEALAALIKEKVDEFDEQQVKILEVGAGDGRLAYFLRQKLKELCGERKIKFKATDLTESKWDLAPSVYTGEDEIERLNYKSALLKYRPKIVISSWMPNGKDFTKDFREEPNVDMYILIGDREICGDVDSAWANQIRKYSADPVPIVFPEGFREKPNELRELQLCCSDAVPTIVKDSRVYPSTGVIHSTTDIFERVRD